MIVYYVDFYHGPTAIGTFRNENMENVAVLVLVKLRSESGSGQNVRNSERNGRNPGIPVVMCN